jgi:hypothetical protein
MSAMGPGCVKTIQSKFDSQNRNENRDSTQISGLLTIQVLADFT